MVRFQSGLNLEIRDKVELLPHNDLNGLVQLCFRVEEQITRRSTSRKDYHNTSYSKKESKKKVYPSKSKDEGSQEKRGRGKKKKENIIIENI